jgi:N-acetyl-1-D-myo-inositol-2-amino-2-deoxy-alpha-D-glucopyranoside deacetylase
MLGYADSGAERQARFAAGSLGRATVGQVSRQLVRIVEQENAAALVHYDDGGIYGHVDHVRVAQAGAHAARSLGIPSYQATVDPARLRRRPAHVLHAAAYAGTPLGVQPARISLTIDADRDELSAKRAAMAAHASQISLDHLDRREFARTYGREWFVRTGPAGVLDALASPVGAHSADG